ncbi:MAG: chemotaxis response regulator protein-glutamate methylesterase [Ilumatobacter sp.]
MSRPARILLVDDSVVIRGLLSRFIDAEPDLEVASTAADGRAGVQKAKALSPDLIVLDVEMPVMNGLEALREIRVFDKKTPIIMFSTLTGQGANVTLDALSAGASDYATKPSTTSGAASALEHVRGELVVKMRALLGRRNPHSTPARPERSSLSKNRALVPNHRERAAVPLHPNAKGGGALRKSTAFGKQLRAVAIGSSTGGPVALEEFLCGISEPLSVPMFVVQHMPAKFTLALAERLDRRSSHRVVEVSRRMVAEPGSVYIAPGGRHMRVRKTGTSVEVEPFDGPPVNSCTPSVDPTFESIAAAYGSESLVVMLTGMGADGTVGTRQLAELGCDVIAQDEETSVVWGMPGSVVENGLATEVLPLTRIGPRVADLAHSRAALAGARGGRT